MSDFSVMYQVKAREQKLERIKKEDWYEKRESDELRAYQRKVFQWVQKPNRKNERAQCWMVRMKLRLEGERNRATREGAQNREVRIRAECLKIGRVEPQKSLPNSLEIWITSYQNVGFRISTMPRPKGKIAVSISENEPVRMSGRCRISSAATAAKPMAISRRILAK